MKYHTYILFSPTIDRYYTGSTSDTLEQRLRKHNSNHSGFTGRANDWKILFDKSFESISEARLLEKKIKKRGAKRFLANLG